MSDRRNILLIEDNPADQELFRERFSATGLADRTLHIRSRLADGMSFLGSKQAEALLLDLSLPDSTGLSGFQEVRTAHPALPVVIFTGLNDLETALQAIQLGAQDYLEKWKYDELLIEKSIRYAVERQKLLSERDLVNRRLEKSLEKLDQANSSLRSLNENLEQLVTERTQGLNLAKERAERQHHLITQGLHYARSIQSALLPDLSELRRDLPELFVLHMPRDIVSGDFYWHAQCGGEHLVAVADCTGHGVPGALLSVMGHTQLNRIVKDQGITDPGAVLSALDEQVRRLLHQSGSRTLESGDGMDIALIAIHPGRGQIRFAGAMRSLFHFRNGRLTVLIGSRRPVGGKHRSEQAVFATREITLHPGDSVYLFSDGYPDQFGGMNGKKLKTKYFINLLGSMHSKGVQVQRDELERYFTKWKGNHEQLDDVLILGMKF